MYYHHDLSKRLPKEIANEKYDYIVSTYVIHHFDLKEKINLIIELKQKLRSSLSNKKRFTSL